LLNARPKCYPTHMKILLTIARTTIAYTALSIFTVFLLHGQDKKPMRVEIQKKDGSEVGGTLIGAGKDSVRLSRYAGDTLAVSFRDIKTIDYVDPNKRSYKWDEQPNTTRYLLTPSAHTLRKGEVTYQNTYLLLNGVQVGITDRIMAGAGADIFTGSTFFITSKFNLIQKPKYKFSAGANFFRLPKDFIEDFSGEDIRNMGMAYGAGTWGNTNANFTVGAGYLIMKGDALPPIVTLSGTLRFLENFAVVTENWFFFVGDKAKVPTILSGGLRYIGEEVSVDVGVYTDHRLAGEFFFPFVSYTRRLNW
jgi:opacity protein-like surface antigen